MRALFNKQNVLKVAVMTLTSTAGLVLLSILNRGGEVVDESTEVYEEVVTTNVPVEETVVTEVKRTRTRPTAV